MPRDSSMAAAFILLPEPLTEAPKPVREAHGVFAVCFGTGGFVIGGFVGSWTANVISRRFGRRGCQR
jgi:hypothetical protein